MTVARE